MSHKSKIEFVISMDENKVPERIDWIADEHKSECKAIMATVWDEAEKNTLRIDLWTKEMMVEEMKHFCVQSIITLADTFERATNDLKSAEDLREFGKKFGIQLGVIKEGPEAT
ncbi:MAG: gliding motility protein GldC [Vicingaceae bacterium]